MNITTTKHQTLLDTIGNTPLVQLTRSPPEVDIFAKLETFNPGGSVKDRIGKYILEQLLETGTLPEGGTIVEPTAGNTGIGMAIAAAQLDLTAVFVVPRGFSREKEVLMQALGAEIVHVDNDVGMAGATERAFELAEEYENAVVPQQFANHMNVEAHEQTTGPEVLEALDGNVGALVVGIGSGGTLMGMAKAVQQVVPTVRVIAVEPAGSAFGSLLGKNREPAAYKTEGIGTHNPTVSELLDPTMIDDIIAVTDQDAHQELKRLAREEGHLVGSSAGAASVAAHEIATKIAADQFDVPHPTVVTVFPDGSERYLSKRIYGEFEEWQGKE